MAATPGDAQCTLTWEAPASWGTLPDRVYVVDISGGDQNPLQETCFTAKCAVAATATSVTVSGLVGGHSIANGSEYTLRIQASAANSDLTVTRQSAHVTVSCTPGLPAAPTGLTLSPGDTVLTASWTAPANSGSAITGYHVHYTASTTVANDSPTLEEAGLTVDAADGWVAVSRSGTTASQTISGLTNSTAYRVRVRAVNANGAGAWSDEMSGTPVGPPSYSFDAAAYTFVEGQGSTDTRISMTRTGAIQKLTQVIFSVVPGATATRAAPSEPCATGDDYQVVALFGDVTPGNSSTTTHVVNVCDDSVAEDTESFTLRIEPGTGYVVGSQSETVVTIVDNEVPGAPGNLQVAPGNTRLDLAWTKGAGTVTTYELQYRPSSASNWTTISVDGDKSSYGITSLTNDTAYDVQVRAISIYVAGSSAWVTGSGTPTSGANANLSALTGSTSTDGSTFGGTLTLAPDFARARTGYTASVATDVTHVKLTPTKAHSAASIQVGKGTSLSTVSSGSASGAIALGAAGSSTALKVEVTAGDGTKVYTVTVTRAAGTTQSSDANLSALTASSSTSAGGTFSTLGIGTFGAATTSYTASVANSVTHVKLTPTVAESNATVKVGKAGSLATVTSGSASTAIALSVGANAIKVEVTAQNGTTKDYTVTVTRAAFVKPTVPQDVQVVSYDGECTILWQAPVSWGTWPAYVYEAEIYKGGSWADPQTYEPEKNPDEQKRHRTFTGLTNGQTYSVRIRAASLRPGGSELVLADFGISPYVTLPASSCAPQASSTTDPPGAVTGLVVTPGNKVLHARWTVPSRGVTGYDLHHTSSTTVDGDEPFKLPGDASNDWIRGGGLHDILTNSRVIGLIGISRTRVLTNGLTYRVRVRAKNAHGDGPWTFVTGTPRDNTGGGGTPPGGGGTPTGGGGGAAADLEPSFGGATVSDQSYTAGTAIAALTLPLATGGDGTLRYSLTPAAPSGLTLDAGSRTLTGTPTGTQGETRYTWTATDADGDTDTLTFVIAVAEDPRRALVQDAVKSALAAVARRAMSSALDNIGARFADIGASSVSLAGQPVPLEGSAAMVSMAEDNALRSCAADRFGGFGSSGPPGCAASQSRPLTAGELFGASAFSLHLGAAEGAGGAGARPLWSIWGRGDLGSFAGRGDAGLHYDGKLRTGWLGVDTRAGSWVAGLAMSHGTGEADYGLSGGALTGRGRLETTLTAVYPYGRWTPGEGLELRGVAGAGEGEARHGFEDGERETGDLTMRMASLGVRRSLPDVAGLALAVRADASVTRIETGRGPAAIHGLSADSWRLRAGVEASRRFALEGAAAIEPFLEAAARRDGGDGLEGSGVELAGGLRYHAPGVSVEARGRWLAAHREDDAEEQGVSLTARAGPGADGRGLFLALSPRWGAGTGGAQALWNEELPNPAASGNGGAMDAQIGYGFALPEAGLLTPFAEAGLAGGERRRLRLGTRFAARHAAFGVELAGERRESGAAPPEHALRLDLQLRF